MTTTATIIERGISFSDPLIAPIREGAKTVTRRVVTEHLFKPYPGCSWQRDWLSVGAVRLHESSEWRAYLDNWRGVCIGKLRCPFGKPGDRLWVREAFYVDLMPWSEGGSLADINVEDAREHIYYRADGPCCKQIPECACAEVGKVRWRPARFMPRWASRFDLEVVDVRCERLHAIDWQDAVAEGMKDPRRANVRVSIHNPRAPRHQFRVTWEKLHGDGSWASNPFVWRVQFKRIATP